MICGTIWKTDKWNLYCKSIEKYFLNCILIVEESSQMPLIEIGIALETFDVINSLSKSKNSGSIQCKQQLLLCGDHHQLSPLHSFSRIEGCKAKIEFKLCEIASLQRNAASAVLCS